MKKVVIGTKKYDNLYHKNKESLLKISILPIEVWESFCNKKLKFVNSPTEYHEITKQEKRLYHIKQNTNKKSIVTLPYLHGYQTLCDTIFENTFTTKDILQLLKKNMNILKHIHQKNITHGDIHGSNIMINKKHDIEFIDWDLGTYDEYISEENTFFDDKISDKEKINRTIHQDKLDLLLLYFSYLSSGDFTHYLDKDYLSLSMQHKNALNEFIKEKTTSQDYYYIDFIDDLINTDYQAPIIYKRNLLHK